LSAATSAQVGTQQLTKHARSRPVPTPLFTPNVAGSFRTETHMTTTRPTTATEQEHTTQDEQQLSSRAKGKQPLRSRNPSVSIVPPASESPNILSNTNLSLATIGSDGESQPTAIEQEVIARQLRSRAREKQPQLANLIAGSSGTKSCATGTESNESVQSATEQGVTVPEELRLASQKKPGSRSRGRKAKAPRAGSMFLDSYLQAALA
jgi:hypothetical protein